MRSPLWLLLPALCVSVTHAFSDVDPDAPYTPAVLYLHEAGVIQGYSDGTFGPQAPVNRAELLKMLLAEKPDAQCPQPLPEDIDPRQWYGRYVVTALCNGIVQGYPDGLFRPERSVTLAEAAKIITRSRGLIPLQASSEPWYAVSLEALSTRSALPVSLTGLDTPLTRANFAEILYRLMTENTTLPSLHYTAEGLQLPENTSASATTMTTEQAALAEKINAARSAVGAEPLTHSPLLSQIATRYAEQMASQRHFSHTGRDGSTMQSRMTNGGYIWSYYAENIGRGHLDVPELFQRWMDSPPHRSNIENTKVTEFGFGAAHASSDDLGYSSGYYWVMMMGAPCQEAWCQPSAE